MDEKLADDALHFRTETQVTITTQNQTKCRDIQYCSVISTSRGKSREWTNRSIVSCTPSRRQYPWYCHSHHRTSHCEHIDKAKSIYSEWVLAIDSPSPDGNS
jgi:hypothetical protein